MLGMDRVYVIRHKWHQEGLSIRQIARDLEISRNTVRKYIDDAGGPRQPARSKRARPVLEKVHEADRRDPGGVEYAHHRQAARHRDAGGIANSARRGTRWAARRCAPTWRSGAGSGRKCLCR